MTGQTSSSRQTALAAVTNVTAGYGLPLPSENDNYDIDVVNEVTQKIDAALMENQTQIEQLNSQLADKIIVIPKNEDIPVSQRKTGAWYLKVTDVASRGGNIRVSPNMGIRSDTQSASGLSFT